MEVLREVARVVKKGGYVAICFVPRDSEWGKLYELRRTRSESTFYRFAKLYTHREVVSMASEAGLSYVESIETLCWNPTSPQHLEMPRKGFSGCGFVCIKTRKL